jgi:hypothetical protein
MLAVVCAMLSVEAMGNAIETPPSYAAIGEKPPTPKFEQVILYVAYLGMAGRRITHIVPSAHFGDTSHHRKFNAHGCYFFPPRQPLWMRDLLQHHVKEQLTLIVDRSGNIYKIRTADAVIDLTSYWAEENEPTTSLVY